MSEIKRPEGTDKELANIKFSGSPELYHDEPEEWNRYTEYEHIRAWYRLESLTKGENPSLNFPESQNLFQFCFNEAHSGNRCAQYALGKMYLTGTLVQQNTFQAGLWFTKASDQGSPFACYELAKMIAFGDEFEKNIDSAAAMFRQAYQSFAEIEERSSNSAVELLMSVIRRQGISNLYPENQNSEVKAVAPVVHSIFIMKKAPAFRHKTIHRGRRRRSLTSSQHSRYLTNRPKALKLQSKTAVKEISAPVEPTDTISPDPVAELCVSTEAVGPCKEEDLSGRLQNKNALDLTEQKHIIELETPFLKENPETTVEEPPQDMKFIGTLPSMEEQIETEVKPLKPEVNNTQQETMPESSILEHRTKLPSENHNADTPAAEKPEGADFKQPKSNIDTVAIPSDAPSVQDKKLSSDFQEQKAADSKGKRVLHPKSEADPTVEYTSGYKDPRNFKEAVHILEALPSGPGETCAVLDGNQAVCGEIDRVEIYQNALLLSVTVGDLRRPYPVSMIGKTIFIGSECCQQAQKAMEQKSFGSEV